MTRRRNGSALVQRSQDRPRPVVPRADELADGLPAPAEQTDPELADILARIKRNPDGTAADAESARLLGMLGGLAKAARDRELAEVPRLARQLGLREPIAEDFAPYIPDAVELAEHECARLARVVGGGECGNGPTLLVQSAALQTAGSRYAFARGDLITGSRLADAARANLLSAHDLCAKEARARPPRKSDVPSWLRPEPERAEGAES